MGTGVSNENLFIVRLRKIVEANLDNEHFGTNELAAKAGLSRSQIHRRLKKSTNKSVSQFIREIRLENAKEFLEKGNLTVSEIAYKVGFGSPSYFIKSFHDYFGNPPGEYVKNIEENTEKSENEVLNANYVSGKTEKNKAIKSNNWIVFILVFIFLVVIVYVLFQNRNVKTIQNPDEYSVLVLPLKNLSSDESKQYFAEGLSNTIRNQLAKISGLNVISGPSADQFRESTLAPVEIARQVNANYILTGSAQLQDNVVLINIELSDATQGRRLWGDNYTKVTDDFLGIQLDIAKNVADQLQLIVTSEEIKQIEKLQPKNFEAYNYYLLGRYLWDRRDSISLQKSVEYFKKAIQTDSDFGLAYAGLADAYYAQSFRGFIERDSGYRKAFNMATSALKMDDSLSEAYTVLGIVNYFGFWNWEEARNLLKKALAINSNCEEANLYYCSLLDIVGEPDNALKHANRAIELEPYFHMPYVMKGVIYRNEKKYSESTGALRKSLALEPESWESFSLVLLNLFSLDDDSSTVRTLKEFFSVYPEYLNYKNMVQSVYETSGRNGLINLFLDVNLKNKKQNLYLIASLYNLLGMQNEALTCLERACRERDRDIPRMIRKPEFGNLHSNPRFQALVDTMNLRPYFHESEE